MAVVGSVVPNNCRVVASTKDGCRRALTLCDFTSFVVSTADKRQKSHSVSRALGNSSIFTTEPFDVRLRDRFVGRHFENFRTWTVGRGIDIDHYIRDTDQNVPNAHIVLYRRHCDICASDFLF